MGFKRLLYLIGTGLCSYLLGLLFSSLCYAAAFLIVQYAISFVAIANFFLKIRLGGFYIIFLCTWYFWYKHLVDKLRYPRQVEGLKPIQ